MMLLRLFVNRNFEKKIEFNFYRLENPLYFFLILHCFFQTLDFLPKFCLDGACPKGNAVAFLVLFLGRGCQIRQEHCSIEALFVVSTLIPQVESKCRPL